MRHPLFKAMFAGMLALLALPALAVPIADGYIGGRCSHSTSPCTSLSNKGDVIGSTSIFQIHGMDVTLSAGSLSVVIDTNFAGMAGNTSFSSYFANGAGIGYGDLFLSAGYTGSQYDHAENGNTWTYALGLDDWYASSTTVRLYELTGPDNVANAILTDDLCTGNCGNVIYRNGQEIIVDPLNASVVQDGNQDVTGTFDVVGNSLVFSIDISDTDLNTDILNAGSLGLHWGMFCGNDIIEGEYTPTTVPAPSVLILLGAGLAGLVLVRRKV